MLLTNFVSVKNIHGPFSDIIALVEKFIAMINIKQLTNYLSISFIGSVMHNLYFRILNQRCLYITFSLRKRRKKKIQLAII